MVSHVGVQLNQSINRWNCDHYAIHSGVQNFCSDILFWILYKLKFAIRKLLLLENVQALLSGHPECRKLLNYVLKAWLRQKH